MKKFLLASALFLLAVFAPQQAAAQGTYTCQFLINVCQAGTGFQFNNCDSGYKPGGECASLGQSSCTGTKFSCVRDTGQTACAENYGGTCKISCNPSSESTIGGFGNLGCVTPTARCCVPSNVCKTQYDGTCKNSCNGDEQEVGGRGQLGCSGFNAQCCTLTDEARAADPTCGENGGGIDTAIGCIPVENPEDFIGYILGWAIGVGGGIAFLLIVVAGLQIMTAQGQPDKLQAGRELLTSAISGLIMLIFSVFILRIIGVNILGIPGLS